MSDLTFNGGATGASLGNQQYTMRNLVFNNCQTGEGKPLDVSQRFVLLIVFLVGIIQLWNWGWTYINTKFNNCGTGIDISAPGADNTLAVGSAIILDSSFSDTEVAIKTAYTTSTTPDTAGSLILENVSLSNVPTAVMGGSGSLLEGGSKTIAGWGQGHRYVSGTDRELSGDITANERPAVLTGENGYYSRSKPQYEDLAASDFVSARSSGAKGDGTTDDVGGSSFPLIVV